ncbi:MAG: hypothetical protein IBX72_11375 [Nitrospirae bacterium]|nr:hypothetical protein [Nitrospirota bacterium]
MIQIDDAGWGSLLLGVIIAGYRPETSKFICTEIPVEMFQGENFSKEAYRKGAVKAAEYVLSKLDYHQNEHIEICTGYVLDGIRGYLSAKGLCYKSGKITGPLQEKIEMQMLENLKKIGLKDLDYETVTEKHGLFFWKSLRWLKGGDVNGRVLSDREKFAKTGWPTYHIWALMPYERARVEAKRYKNNRRRGFYGVGSSY